MCKEARWGQRPDFLGLLLVWSTSFGVRSSSGFSCVRCCSHQVPGLEIGTSVMSLLSLLNLGPLRRLLRASFSWLPVEVQCQDKKTVVTIQREIFRKGQLVNPSHSSLSPADCPIQLFSKQGSHF